MKDFHVMSSFSFELAVLYARGLSVSKTPLDLVDPKFFISRSKIETLRVLDELNPG